MHVLGLPPAFVLSQDQTLMFDNLILNRTRIESNPGWSAFAYIDEFQHAKSQSPKLALRVMPFGIGIEKRKTVRVFYSHADKGMNPFECRPARTPPPAFLFLISYNDVKERLGRILRPTRCFCTFRVKTNRNCLPDIPEPAPRLILRFLPKKTAVKVHLNTDNPQ